jgi:tetratricopeptide (TPR) repeat protein
LNKERFISYLQDPGLLNQDTLPEMENLVREFPYFQSARMLYALNLLQTDHMLYESELKNTAIHAGDRRMLKKHLDNLQSAAESEEKVIVEEPKTPEVKEDTDQEKLTIEQPGLSIEKEMPPEEETADPEPEEIAAAEKEVELDEPVITDEEVIQEVAELEPLPDKVVKEDLTETEASEETVVETKEDRMAMLKSIVEARLRAIEEERRAALEEAAASDEVPAAVSSVTESPTVPETELIDEFIKNEPSISRTPAPFFDPVEAAKGSVVDEENIVSETLATIYFDQGKYEKAINIYKKLSLTNPEKSSYFARLIEKAKEELKK